MQSEVRARVRAPLEPGASFELALRAVRDEPADEEAWELLEAECEHTNAPDQVAAAYLRMLTPGLAPEPRRALAQRAYAFHESWLGDDLVATERLLQRVLELDPETEWALDELIAVLTAADRWDALLDAYDLALRAELAPARRARLLDEAAHVAKDFADRPERAIGYLRELAQLDPRADALANSIARMLQERSLWRPLIELLEIQATLRDAPVAALRLRVAELHLEELQEPEQALQHACELLALRPGDAGGCALLGRILALDAAPAPLRLQALGQLRRHHDLANRAGETIEALELALVFTDGAQAEALLRELAERLVAAGALSRAQARWAELLQRSPGDVQALAQLAHIAERGGDHEAHARALEAATASASEPALAAALTLDAMRVRSQQLGQREPALALGRELLALEAAPRALQRQAALLMDPLLRAAGLHTERLDVLEGLGASELEPATRRFFLAEAARVARLCGEPVRALAAWDVRLADDATDLEALAAAIELTGELNLYAAQAERLTQRARLAPSAAQRRQDLVRVAELQATALERPDAAIETWLALRDEFGDAPDALGALDQLLSQRSRFSELARIYEVITGQEQAARVENLCRLAELYRIEPADVDAAVRCYARALELAPEWEPARVGLRALLESTSELALPITSALARAYEATDDWQLCVDLLDARLTSIECTKTQARLMLEVAALCEQRACDARAALSLVGKALTRSPFDGHAERELLRLAGLTGNQREAALALSWTAAICADRERVADLKTHEARLCERIDDHQGAAAAYVEVLKVRPEARGEAHALVRAAARAGSWQLACEAALRSCRVRGVVEPEVLEQLESAADAQTAYGELCAAFAGALAAAAELPAPLGFTLELRLSDWYFTRCSNLDGAERAAHRAVAHCPGELAGLTRLAELQRRCAAPGLVDTLVALASHDCATAAPLHEAARLALEPPLTPERRRELLRALYRRVSSLYAARAQGSGAGEPLAEWLSWTLERLVPLELSLDCADVAVHLLDDAARLPLPDRERAQLGAQCARLLERKGDAAEALRVGLCALERRSDDLELVRWLAQLAAKLRRVPDELALRKHELTLSQDPERRLALRLEIARLTGLLEAQDGRLSMLLANLHERCGHEASIGAACDLLAERSRFGELVALLLDQAAGLSRAAPERATPLLRRAAEIAERRLDDLEQAIEAHTRAVPLPGGESSLEQLVRLCRQAGDPLRSAHWLARQIEVASRDARPALYVQLAHEQLAAGQPDTATESLLGGFREHPEDSQLRELLTERLRVVGRERELAEVLSATALVVDDAVQSAELSREAARLFGATGHDAEALVRSAERALARFPEDRELSLLLTDGLSALGQREAARQELLRLLALYGRRRSPERGLVHVKLAELLRSEGDLPGACAELELALQMRAQDVTIMHALAQLAEQAGDLTRRERALHALRLAARRGPLQLAGGCELGTSEILLALSEIARTRGDDAHAASLRESALLALDPGSAECERVKRRLEERGELELLEQILRSELSLEPRAVVRAAGMARLANVLERRGASAEAAFELRLAALELDPVSPRLHEAALSAARAREECPRLRALLEKLLTRANRPGDAYARCEICLRLGASALEERDLARALAHYREAEACGVREADVWRAQLRLAVEHGDAPLQRELLARLSTLGEAELEGEGGEELLYRMAEIRLASADTRDEGMLCLRDALAHAPRPARVGRLLSRTLAQGPCDPSLLPLLGELARRCSDAELLQLGELYVEHGDEELLNALLAPLAGKLRAKRAHASLRARRAGRLLRADAASEAARALLVEALALSPGCVEAEDMLLECFEASGEQVHAVSYLLQRFDQVRAADDAAGYARYALKLQEFPAAGEARVDVLRAAARKCPERAELWQALSELLTTPEQALERAQALERLLALDDGADVANAALEAAEIYQRAGDHEGVVRVLSAARQSLPAHAGLQRRLIDACRAQRDPAALAALLEQLARSEQDPAQAAELWQEASVLWRDSLDDLGATVDALEGAVAALPREPRLRRQLADALRAVGRDEDAIAQLGYAIDCCEDPAEHARLVHARARTLLDQGNLIDGVDDLEAVRARAPDLVEDALLELAEALCRRAAEHNDASTARAAALKLAALRRARAQLAEAALLLESSLAHEPHDAPALAQLAELYAALQRPEALARVCMLQLELSPEAAPIEPVRQLVALLPQLADPKQALGTLTQAHARQPERDELEQALVDAHTAISDHGALARLWIARGRRATDTPERSACLHQAARHMLASGATEAALHLLQRIQGARPEQIDVTLTLTETLLAEHRHAEARDLLEAALARRPDPRPAQRAQLLCLLARVAHAAGDRDAALAHMQAAREADKTNRAILAELAVLAEELGAWDVAERALIALLLLKRCDVMPRGELLLRRARVALRLSGPAQALIWARKAQEAAPDSAEIAALIVDLQHIPRDSQSGFPTVH
jgi:hypothetical protein